MAQVDFSNCTTTGRRSRFVTGSTALCTSTCRKVRFPVPRRRPMPVIETHPKLADLEAFALGTLDNDSLVSLEAHVSVCSTCQERAAAASGDTLVELLRRVHTQMGRRTDIVTEVARMATPVPVPAGAEDATPAPASLAGHSIKGRSADWLARRGSPACRQHRHSASPVCTGAAPPRSGPDAAPRRERRFAVGSPRPAPSGRWAAGEPRPPRQTGAGSPWVIDSWLWRRACPTTAGSFRCPACKKLSKPRRLRNRASP